MKQGRTLTELAIEIERQSATKRDFIASTSTMELRQTPATEDAASQVVLSVPSVGALPINSFAHSQIAGHLDIPKKYYDRMLAEQPKLLTDNVNTWFKREGKGTRRMVRTLDGNARAFLSDRFQPFDNDVIAEQALSALHEVAPTMQIASCELTERRLYLKAIFPTIQREVVVGDVVQSGIIISNSEVGAGALSVAPFSFRLVCLNGMTHNDFGHRRAHLGRAIESENAEIFASDTLRADAKAFLLKLRDVIRSTVDPAQFKRIVDKMSEAAGQKVEGDPIAAVEVMTRKLNLLEGEKTGVLRHLIEGGDLSRWGMANAVTRAAADIADYDRATELEALGGKVIELAPKDWREIAIAA